MNPAADGPGEGQVTGTGAGPVPDPDLPGPQAQPRPGVQTAQQVWPPPADTRPAGEEPAVEDSRSEGGPEGSRSEGGPEGSRSGSGPEGSRSGGRVADRWAGNEPGPPGGPAVSAGAPGGPAAGRESRARLLDDDELQRVVTRWKEIQAHFVDEPRTAVEQADALVAGLMQQLAAMFARERAELEQRWAGGTEASTEELRQSLRRYRSFFERLLAA